MSPNIKEAVEKKRYREIDEIYLNPYVYEAEGQQDFFNRFNIDREKVIHSHTDGVYNGNILEFKLSIPRNRLDTTLFQAIKYLSRLRVTGHNVPANIVIVDLNRCVAYIYNAWDYYDAIHRVYTTAASRHVKGFRASSKPRIIRDYFGSGRKKMEDVLAQNEFVSIDITVDCVVAWAERYYREVKGSTKATLLDEDGELRNPRHFEGLINPYTGNHNEEFAYILDRLNDKLQKIELGAFFTPEQYTLKSHELLREAIERVPEGNDYVIVDRCAGTGNLIRGLTEDELSHVIVNTYEQFEYLELVREFGGRVRELIPPSWGEGEPELDIIGVLRNGDALAERFVLGEKNVNGKRKPNAIQQYVDNPHCTIILFENPPYAGIAPVEAQKQAGRNSFGWKSSFVRSEMTKWLSKTDSDPTNELANLFIWSAFEYYLRQPTDSYVVFSPVKYFKQHNLIDKRFVRGFLFNRKHFALKDAGISVILWSNENEVGRTKYKLDMFDLDRNNVLVPGAMHKDGRDITSITVRTTSKRLSTLYDYRKFAKDEEDTIACETNGKESMNRKPSKMLYNPNILGCLVSKAFLFENVHLNTRLTRCMSYDGAGFYLRRDNFLTKLPLFAVGRYPSEGRYWVRGVLNGNADNGDNFSHDQDFLKACLIYTCLSNQNKCLSFVGSNNWFYRNELCFDVNTVASKELRKFKLTDEEDTLMEQWKLVLKLAKRTRNYDSSFTYGPYQIDMELNERHKELIKGKVVTVFEYEKLNDEIRKLKRMNEEYYMNVIAKKMWDYGLIK